MSESPWMNTQLFENLFQFCKKATVSVYGPKTEMGMITLIFCMIVYLMMR